MPETRSQARKQDDAGKNPIPTSRDAESVFRSKPISQIRSIESQTKAQIQSKSEELRQLVGRSYRDLIESADSIISMKFSTESINSNLSSIESSLSSLSSSNNPENANHSHNTNRSKIYSLACRVKYLVDTPENIWGCLDESMLLEASGRYLRARNVYNLVTNMSDLDIFAKFPLLKHQWQIVESFKGQISMKSRERLMDQDLIIGSYADALAAAAVIDGLDPNEVLGLFLDVRKSWIEQKMNGEVNGVDYGSVLCKVVNIVKTTLGQVGELFLLALNEMPLFYKLVLGTPPGTQLFGGIPNPEEEVRLWKVHREKLESVMVMLDSEYIAKSCSDWLGECCDMIFGGLSNGKRLLDSTENGDGLANVEKLVRESLDGREDLESSLEQWLKNVFGSDIESPWDQIRGIILKDGKNILEERMEEAFVKRMKDVLYSRFDDLKKDVNLKGTVEAIVANSQNENDFKSYMKKRSTGGGFWFTEPNHKKMALGVGFKPTSDENDFKNCLNAYFGVEVSRIGDVVDAKCSSILEDLLVFVECYNSTLRLKELAPYLQENCFETMSKIIKELENELGLLSSSLENRNSENIQPPSVLVERSLFIGRLLFALRNHSKQIPLILGSPRNWVKETSSVSFTNVTSPFSKRTKGSFDSPIAFSPRRQTFDSPGTPGRQFIDSPRSPRRQFLDSPRRQTISAAAALYAMDGNKNPKLEELNKTLEELCIKAHNLWIIWVSSERSTILSKALHADDTLSMSTPSRGWEVTVVKQEQSSEGSPEMKIALPSMPSLYITSFLFQACLEIHKIGGHVLDKSILRNFSGKLLEKIVGIYDNFLSTIGAPDSQVSDKGILQILLDIKFSADILSGGKDNSKGSESNTNEKFSKTSKPPFRRKHIQASTNKDPITSLIQKLSQKLDPIDWATYEPYLWENEKQSYKRFAVLFGFLVQLNRMYTETVQKLPTGSNTESNIMRCSTIPRFSYLPISAPALSSRGQHKSSLQTSAEDLSSRSSRISYSNGDRSPKHELDDSASFVASTPLLKSFMTQCVLIICTHRYRLEANLEKVHPGWDQCFQMARLGSSKINQQLLCQRSDPSLIFPPTDQFSSLLSLWCNWWLVMITKYMLSFSAVGGILCFFFSFLALSISLHSLAQKENRKAAKIFSV